MSAPEQQSATGVPAGYPGDRSSSTGVVGAPARNGLGLAGLILGIVSLVASLVPLLGVPVSVVGLVLSIVGHHRARRGEATNRRQALAGIVLNALGLVLTIGIAVVSAVYAVNNPEAFGL